MAWPERKDWSSFCHYEKVLNDSAVDQNMSVLCTYPMATSGAADLLDVTSTHQFGVAMRNGSWGLIETRKLKQAGAEIKGMNDEPELRVEQRTEELEAANRKLTEAQADPAHINRVMTMGGSTASIAHDVKQPLVAIVNKTSAGIRAFLQHSRLTWKRCSRPWWILHEAGCEWRELRNLQTHRGAIQCNQC